MKSSSVKFLINLVKNEKQRLKDKRDVEFKVYTALGWRNLDDAQYNQRFEELDAVIEELKAIKG